MEWFWFALAITLFVTELITVQLVSVWFSVGALVTAVVKMITGDKLSLGWQVFIFAVVSAVLLVATRPLVKKLLKKQTEEQKTNMERNLGKTVVVTETIDNVAGTGAIKLDGLIWSARSADDSVIEKDTLVIFKEIQGNKALVMKKEN